MLSSGTFEQQPSLWVGILAVEEGLSPFGGLVAQEILAVIESLAVFRFSECSYSDNFSNRNHHE